MAGKSNDEKYAYIKFENFQLKRVMFKYHVIVEKRTPTGVPLPKGKIMYVDPIDEKEKELCLLMPDRNLYGLMKCA